MEALLKTAKGVLSTIFGDASGLVDIQGVLFTNLLRTPADAVINSTDITSLFELFMPIGLLIMFIGFALKITELITEDQLSVDKAIKELIKFFVIAILMNSCVSTTSADGVAKTGWIQIAYGYVTDISDELMNSAYGGTSGVDSDFQDTLSNITIQKDQADSEESDDDNFFTKVYKFVKHPIEETKKALWSILSSIAFGLMMLGSTMLICLFVFAVGVYRAIKIGIYISLLPISIAMTYYGQSKFTKPFKQLLILFLQDPFILITVAIISTIYSTNNFGLESLAMVVVMTGSMISTIIGSEKKIKELVG